MRQDKVDEGELADGSDVREDEPRRQPADEYSRCGADGTIDVDAKPADGQHDDK